MFVKGHIPWNKGTLSQQKHLEDTKQKISEAMKGKHHSEASKQKMSESHKGHIGWWKGKHLSKEHCKKMSDVRKGKHFSEEHCRKLSESHKGHIGGMKGKTHSEETKRKIGLMSLGRYHSEKTRKKISDSHKGNKSHFYIDGRSTINYTERLLAMNSLDYKLWREKIFQRDNFTCQICKDRGGITLHADHIKPWSKYSELRYELDNGRTLCIDCHRKTDTWGRKVIN